MDRQLFSFLSLGINTVKHHIARIREVPTVGDCVSRRVVCLASKQCIRNVDHSTTCAIKIAAPTGYLNG